MGATQPIVNLFDLTGEALSLSRRIETTAADLFSDDPAAADRARAELEALITAESTNRRALEEKADAWCWVIDEFRARAATQKKHAKRLAALAADAEHRADALKDRLVAALQAVYPDGTGWKLPEHTITSRKSTRVDLDADFSADDLPAALQRVKIEPDKTAIKASLTAGETVPGASLVQARSWTIS
jgi:hypothetical protein